MNLWVVSLVGFVGCEKVDAFLAVKRAETKEIAEAMTIVDWRKKHPRENTYSVLSTGPFEKVQGVKSDT